MRGRADHPAQSVMVEVLVHCGRRMQVYANKVEDGVRTRYWRCVCCRHTEKTVQNVVFNRAGEIANERKRR